jgi:hypothetical protein
VKNQYSEINNSFKKKLVYHLGSEAGFFSEYNNMILAMLYCLKHNIKFELFSEDANFGIQSGWQDYFQSFCNESPYKYHIKLNHRHPRRQSLKESMFTFWFKLTTKTSFLTYEIWPKFRNQNFENENFAIHGLKINGNVRDSARKLIDLTWRYNKSTANEVTKLIQSLKLPDNYVGIHIRGGDKYIEWEKVETNNYLNIIAENSIIKDIFVLTDDYRIVIELKQNYQDYSFFSLCNENEIGYFHSEFSKASNEMKRQDMIKLFASMDILSSSELFVGTFSSNPGMYLGMRMDSDKVKGVDLEKWTIW